MATWYPLLMVVSMLVFAGVAAALVWMGYWMGRNSADVPIRNDNNLEAEKKPDKSLDTGDVFMDSMARDDDERTPTILTGGKR